MKPDLMKPEQQDQQVDLVRQGPSDVEVLAHMAQTAEPQSIRQMAHAMGLRHHGRRMLPRVLAALKRRGAIVEARPGKYRLSGQPVTRPKPKPRHADRSAQAAAPAPRTSVRSNTRARDASLISGRLLAHRDGYGFVVPSAPIPGMDGDLFIGIDGIADAMHGDRVLARIVRRRPDGRAEGRIVEILEREHPTMVGVFHYGTHGNSVLAYDTRILQEVVIPPGAELTPELREKLGLALDATKTSSRLRLPELDGAVVNAEITRFPKGGLAPSGRVIEILGRTGEIGVDVEIMIRKHHLPHVFSEEVLADARAASREATAADLEGRRDFRRLPIVTIDGETARDFDDAVYVARAEDGGYELQVHIADVAHYVRRDSPLDHEARLRGTSVYFPNRAVPMLPEELSNGICSLNPQVDRLVMSVVMQFDHAGKLREAEFMPGVICSVERMTYTNVNKVLEGDAEALAHYSALADEFARMRELALLLNAQRTARGSIDFDLPEPIIEFDSDGRMTGIVRSERNIAHRLIEEFMLAANEAVARTLERHGLASLHRVHEKPAAKKVLEFEQIALTFGYTLGIEDLFERRIPVKHGRVRAPGRGERAGRGRMRPMELIVPSGDEVNIRPQHYQRLTAQIAGKPEERILSYLMLRSLKQARYAAEPLGHFALATSEYTHFTSPIRRYPDLIVHRVLQWALKNVPESGHWRASDPRTVSATHPASASAAQDSAEHLTPKKVDAPSAVKGPYRRAALDEISVETSEAKRLAESAERELMDWKTAQFMESHLGEEYDALIISVQKFGFFVELVEIFIEGLIPVDRLEESIGERCLYRESDHAIVGQRSRRSFHLGDRVRVRAERIDLFRQRVEFALVDEIAAKR